VVKLSGTISTTFAVAVIVTFIDPPGIVKDSKQLDDFDLRPRDFR
jgi:hypothetical protein